MATEGLMGQWHFRDGANWVPYDPHSNTLIENAYKTGTKETCINNYTYSYIVDLSDNKQTNVDTGTKRDIIRLEIGTDTIKLPVRHPLVPFGAKSYASATSIVPPQSGTYINTTPSPLGTVPPFPPTSLQPTSGTSYPGSLSFQIGTIPATSMPQYGATSDPSFSRPISAPSKSGTKSNSTRKPLSSHDDTNLTPPSMPRKKYKHEPNKFPRDIGTYDTFFHKYTEIKSSKNIPKDEMCPICLTPLLEPADVDIPKKSRSSSLPLEVVCGLKKCSHIFHMVCIGTMLDSTPNVKVNEFSISCPICQTIHGVKTGDQPITGTMNVSRDGSSVPGYEGYGTIKIRYSFSHGVSETGTRYNPAGFPRVCYVPDCPEGKTVLELLNLAWKRRLIFTIGTSVTTGSPNCVVWNNIHHKTEPHSNTSGHGFPDPNFLKNIKMELAVQGVTEEELK